MRKLLAIISLGILLSVPTNTYAYESQNKKIDDDDIIISYDESNDIDYEVPEVINTTNWLTDSRGIPLTATDERLIGKWYYYVDAYNNKVYKRHYIDDDDYHIKTLTVDYDMCQTQIYNPKLKLSYTAINFKTDIEAEDIDKDAKVILYLKQYAYDYSIEDGIYFRIETGFVYKITVPVSSDIPFYIRIPAQFEYEVVKTEQIGFKTEIEDFSHNWYGISRAKKKLETYQWYCAYNDAYNDIEKGYVSDITDPQMPGSNLFVYTPYGLEGKVDNIPEENVPDNPYLTDQMYEKQWERSPEYNGETMYVTSDEEIITKPQTTEAVETEVAETELKTQETETISTTKPDKTFEINESSQNKEEKNNSGILLAFFLLVTITLGVIASILLSKQKKKGNQNEK